MPVCVLMKVLKSSKALITMAAFVRSFACKVKGKWSHYFPNHLLLAKVLLPLCDFPTMKTKALSFE